MTEHSEHSEHVDRETERIRAIRWCEPDVAMESRDPEAIAWLEARADELGAALAGCGPFDGAIPVRTTSSLRELVRVWRESLVAGGRTLSWALAKAAKELKRDPLEARSFADVEALVRDSQRASDGWRAVYREQPQTRPVEVIAFGVEIRPPDDAWSLTGRPGAMTCAKHLEWCAAFGAARPSPWEPFVAMFERGVWPTLSGGALFVYVPARADPSLDAGDVLRPEAAPVTDATITSPSERAAIGELRRVGAPCPPWRFAAQGEALGRPLACLRYAYRPQPVVEPPATRAPDKGRLRELSDRRTKEMRDEDDSFDDD